MPPNPYCDIERIKTRIPEKILIQLTDDDRLGVIDMTKVAAAISRADRYIDSKCGIKYRVPFESPTEVIADASADLSSYYLYSRKAEKIPETRADEYKNAVRLLDQIADGKATPGGEEQPTPAAEDVRVRPVVRAPERLFSADKLSEF